MRNMPERWKGQFRSIYEILWEDPRILNRNMTSKIGKDAGKILKEALEYQYIIGPQARKKSFQNLREYVYIAKCDNPELLYLEYLKDENVIYHAKMIGFCNLFLITKEKFNLVGDIIVEGFRSDYYVSHPPDHSWETAIEIIRKETEMFDAANYLPVNYINNHLDTSIEWSEEDELLYSYFKYDLRKPLTPVMRKLKVSKDKIYNFLERLPETCTVFTDYYPESISAYDPYLFMFETDYEDFIIELFSELPTTSSFFKVSDKLFALMHLPQDFVRTTNYQKTSNLLFVPLIVIDLLKKGIIKKGEYAIVQNSWAKDL